MVQDFGSRLLLRQDNIAAGKARIDTLYVGLLASGRGDVQDLFPEYFPAKDLVITEDAPMDILDNPDADFDFSDVSWESPGEGAEDDFALLQAFLDGQVEA